MPLEEAQHLRAGRGHADEVVGRLEVEVLERALEVVDRVVVAELRPHLLGQAGAALVVAQHAELRRQAGRHTVPAVERAAHLVQQHHHRAVIAGELIVKAYSVSGHPRQGDILPVRCSISACPGKVETGFPIRTCATERIESTSRNGTCSRACARKGEGGYFRLPVGGGPLRAKSGMRASAVLSGSAVHALVMKSLWATSSPTDRSVTLPEVSRAGSVVPKPTPRSVSMRCSSVCSVRAALPYAVKKNAGGRLASQSANLSISANKPSNS